jgi:predicted MarR family transcription regulator
MIERGLIARVDGAGRAVRHRLTPLGERAHADGAGIFEGVLEESVGRLTAAEQKLLHELLVKAASAEDR